MVIGILLEMSGAGIYTESKRGQARDKAAKRLGGALQARPKRRGKRSCVRRGGGRWGRSGCCVRERGFGGGVWGGFWREEWVLGDETWVWDLDMGFGHVGPDFSF